MHIFSGESKNFWFFSGIFRPGQPLSSLYSGVRMWKENLRPILEGKEDTTQMVQVMVIILWRVTESRLGRCIFMRVGLTGGRIL